MCIRRDALARFHDRLQIGSVALSCLLHTWNPTQINNAKDTNSKDNAKDTNSKENAKDTNSKDNAKDTNSKDNAKDLQHKEDQEDENHLAQNHYL
jgi:hypothetical protein